MVTIDIFMAYPVLKKVPSFCNVRKGRVQVSVLVGIYHTRSESFLNLRENIYQ